MPAPRNLRAGLTAASARLREVSSPDLAEHVDTVLKLSMYELGAALQEDANLSVTLPVTARDHIVASAPEGKITAMVNEGFTAYLAGEFTPNPPVRARRGTAEDKVNLNVRPDATLRQQVADTGVLPAHVAADWLMQKYQTGPYAPDAGPVRLPVGSVRAPKVPAPVREAIRSRAADAGHNVNAVIEEGFTQFLAGDFTPAAPAWPANADMVPFKVNPNNDLFNQVKEKAKGISPMQVAFAYLLDQYGVDPAAV